ncbi:CYFIP-related Rac1 interactor B-like isoform X2 [Lineus longissimus]|uniref:CYFIP-related Rac1 interactor B-like isoform X2 n=1 Tax=Lineus longissimus TaxID=88925 RepID=UPI00315D5FD4
MGNLLKVLTNRDDAFSKVDFYVDFENCQPAEDELEIWGKVDEVLKASVEILDELGKYTGASNQIRSAISNPREDDKQEAAWQSVCPLVLQLKKFHEFSLKLETIIPEILYALTSGDLTSEQHLEQQQALFKQFAEILDFTLRFDDLKMNNPAIQNDFSYYRRTLSRMKMANQFRSSWKDEVPDTSVSNELANRMSLFYAYPTPMMKTLSDVTAKFVTENKKMPVTNTTDCLSTMANICRVMTENPEYSSRMQNDGTILFCLRVMVGVIILYDHVHPVGAFARGAGIDMKSSIKVLKEQPGGTVDGLLNVLRYTTKHINDESTPKAIKSLLL